MKNKIRTISVREARANFADVLGSVHYGRETITIERKGKPFAVLINPDQYSKLTKKSKPHGQRR